MNSEPLAEGYYLANFCAVLEDVEARCGDLLLVEECALLARFRTLPLAAQRLYVRMLTRKGPWFRQEQLSYPEIGDPGPAIEVLRREGFCLAAPELQDLLPLLIRSDLIEELADAGFVLPKGARREDLLALLQASMDEPILQERLELRLRPVSPGLEQLWRRIFLMYFGNFEQDLATFVVADTGRVRFEAYPVDPRLRPFEARSDVDYLLSIRSLREQLETVSSAAELEVLTATALAMESHPGIRPQRRFQRLLNELGRGWERAGDSGKAVACYTRSERPPARERRVRILACGGDLDAACRLAMELAEAPRDVSESRFAMAFLERHRRKVTAVEPWLQAHPGPEPPVEIRLDLPRHPGGVERAVLEAARGAGWEGFFAENQLWRALFGLLFWEELFADVSGAFQHRFQNAPLDIGEADFYWKRESLIDRRLATLARCQNLPDLLLGMADAKWGVANAFVDWRHLQRGQLAEALARIPVEVLDAVLRLMLRNPRAFDSGFPDLFLYRPEAQAWKLWEVKGPGDSLRPEQDWWLRQFARLGCEARVVRVRYND